MNTKGRLKAEIDWFCDKLKDRLYIIADTGQSYADGLVIPSIDPSSMIQGMFISRFASYQEFDAWIMSEIKNFTSQD
jgi:hypothetical protein